MPSPMVLTVWAVVPIAAARLLLRWGFWGGWPPAGRRWGTLRLWIGQLMVGACHHLLEQCFLILELGHVSGQLIPEGSIAHCGLLGGGLRLRGRRRGWLQQRADSGVQV